MSDITGPLRKRNCTPEGVPAGPVWEMKPRWDTSGILGIFAESFPRGGAHFIRLPRATCCHPCRDDDCDRWGWIADMFQVMGATYSHPCWDEDRARFGCDGGHVPDAGGITAGSR